MPVEPMKAALSLRGRDAAQTTAFIQSFGGSHRYVFDYLAEEVLARQSPTVQAFLQQTAILDRFNAELCAAVTARQDSAALLLHLEQANLFLVPLDDVRTWYRYHHLFADYLRSLLPAEQHREGYRRAVVWLRTQALWVDAVQYALATADADLVADVIEQALSGPSSWSSGNLTMLASWIDALPASVFPSRPNLSLHTARVCYLTGRLDQADLHIHAAETWLQARGATLASEPLLALAAVYRGASAALRGEAAQAMSQITAAQVYLPPDHHIAHARANFSLGLASELLDQTTQAISYYEQTAAAAQAAGVLFLELHAQGAAAQLQVQQGRLSLAAERCQAAQQRAEGARIAPLGLLIALLGGIALERNQLALASQQIHEGLALAQQGGLWNDAVVGLRLASRLALAQGDAATALQRLDAAARLIERHGVPRLQYQVAAARARLQIQLGQVAAAEAWATTYQARRTTLPSETEDLILARWWLARDNPAAMFALVLPVLEQARTAGRAHVCLEACLLLSRAALAKHDQASACDWLAQALGLAAPEGYVRIVLEEGPALLALLPEVGQEAPAYVATVLAQAHPERDHSPLVQAGLREPLSEQELRVLRLIVAGQSNHEIAEALVISVGTAKWHVHNILQKLAVKNRPQAIARARALGLDG
ncbi:MAG: LuxR C-terminal-related transcriptional regulator [Oscillochloridaceae bacterium umkhey_bin13]